jgi:predicted nucleotidyltransferase
MGVEAVRNQRREQRRVLVERAREFVSGLSPELGVRAAVVIGSVARGDFNVWSDVDLLVIADNLPARYLDRLDALGPRPPLVQPIVWTSAEYRQELSRRNPMAVEAVKAGVWLVGAPEQLEAPQ